MDQIRDQTIQDLARAAVDRMDHALAGGPDVDHETLSKAVRSVIELRNRVVAQTAGRADGREIRDRMNAIVSLSFGSEYPLMGIHRHRIEQTRDALEAFADLPEEDEPRTG